jgi:cyclic pyranopterin phosphate synthase
MLTLEELLRVCGIMAELGIHKIRVTGGEPLVRRGMAGFLKKLKAIPGIEKVSLTTNGILLGSFLDEADGLRAVPGTPTERAVASEGSPLDSVNISLDALDRERYMRVSRQENHGPAEILPLIDRLLGKGITVKINCVPIRSLNEDDILPLAALAKDKNIAVRFIELMPLGSAAGLQFVPGAEIASLLEKTYGPLAPAPRIGVRGNGPAVYYSFPGFAGTVGFINPITHGFCETCNRLRLSSEGFLKLCLSHNDGLDLRELLRREASGEELAQAIAAAALKKPRFHALSEVYGALPSDGQYADGMSKIGG